MAQRTAEEIRGSMEANRAGLELSIQRLRGEVVELTDWRAHVSRHRRELLIGAAVVGFALGARRMRRRRRR
jgi:hypothetical protein